MQYSAGEILSPPHRKYLTVSGNAMTTIKLILTAFVWTALSFFACSTTTTKSFHGDPINQDTVYSISTKQLKSNKIPDSVFQMTNLRRLEITGEDCDFRQVDKDGHDITQCWMITEIPSKIKNLQKLTTLNLSLNAITTISSELTELKNLKSLSLTDNAGLQDIDNLTRMQSLENLALYGCNLTRMPNDISNLKNLKELGLVGNHFDKAEQARVKRALPRCIIRF